MSIGPVGMPASVAATPVQQTSSALNDQIQPASADQVKRRRAVQLTDSSHGVGQTQADLETEDRDADGRRHWDAQAAAPLSPADSPPRISPSDDDHEATGSRLDVSG